LIGSEGADLAPSGYCSCGAQGFVRRLSGGCPVRVRNGHPDKQVTSLQQLRANMTRFCTRIRKVFSPAHCFVFKDQKTQFDLELLMQ